MRDFGAVHRRLAPGFVLDARLDDGARVVTFANGTVARELLVDCDDTRRRLVYAVASERVRHYNASVQVIADGEARAKLIWIVDLLPNDIAPYIAGRMDQASARHAEIPGSQQRVRPPDQDNAGRARTILPAFGPHRVRTTLEAESTPSATIEAAASTKKFAAVASRIDSHQPPAPMNSSRALCASTGPITLAAPCDEKYIDIASPMKA